MTSRPEFISLFSGCGGLDVGLEAAGLSCSHAFDIDPEAIQVHRNNVPGEATVADLNKLSASDLVKQTKPKVIVAGSPCQGFSTVGKRDINDPRNSLLTRAGQLATSLRPRVFIAENVAGAISGPHRHYWDSLDSHLRESGYSTTTIRLNAKELGLAQSRSRIFLVAWLGDRTINHTIKSVEPVTLAHALKGVQGIHGHDVQLLSPNSTHYKIAQHIGPGQKLCNVRGGSNSVHTWQIPEVFGRTTATERRLLSAIMRIRRIERIRDFGDADPVKLKSLQREIGSDAEDILNTLIGKGYVRKLPGGYDLTNAFNGKYRRLDWNSISITVDTRFGDPRYFLHPSENRSFTVREAARLQGFPDAFVFSENTRTNYRLIGNAVPPPMGKEIGELAKTLL